ncbi:hypothetical protein BC835DRAFT_1311184 [Cytidiella melzeri]|nr:hypothetical protein BC835DRAFT_1311184 [Cytidiella melzeri]
MASVNGLLKRRGVPSVPKVAVLGQDSGVFGAGGRGIQLVVALLWREWWPESRSVNDRRGMPRLSADTDTDVEWLKECRAEDVGKLSLEAGGTTHQHYHVHHFSCRYSYGARENAKANGCPEPTTEGTSDDGRDPTVTRRCRDNVDVIFFFARDWPRRPSVAVGRRDGGVPPVPKVTVPGQHSGVSGAVSERYMEISGEPLETRSGVTHSAIDALVHLIEERASGIKRDTPNYDCSKPPSKLALQHQAYTTSQDKLPNKSALQHQACTTSQEQYRIAQCRNCRIVRTNTPTKYKANLEGVQRYRGESSQAYGGERQEENRGSNVLMRHKGCSLQHYLSTSRLAGIAMDPFPDTQRVEEEVEQNKIDGDGEEGNKESEEVEESGARRDEDRDKGVAIGSRYVCKWISACVSWKRRGWKEGELTTEEFPSEAYRLRVTVANSLTQFCIV